MPVHLLSPSCQVPAHLSRKSISDINLDPMDWTSTFIEGRVVHKGEPLPQGDDEDFTLKAVIQDVDSTPSSASPTLSIRMTLMGALAKDFSSAVKLGDVVVASGFMVFNSPTAKEKMHPCALLLSGNEPNIYVRCPKVNLVEKRKPSPGATEVSSLQPQVPQVNSVVTRKRSAQTAQTSRGAKTAKYCYRSLGDLEDGAIVNVYGVVVFFKQPSKSRGSDYCTTLRITDQSNQKIGCSVFRAKLEDHPVIFKVGDIIRMHRVKVSPYNGSFCLVSTHGFSVVTFGGAKGEPVEPRSSNQKYSFDDNDRRVVEELRAWFSQQAQISVTPSMTLSAVQPRVYFDLTCQLLAKAPIDSTCTLLRVWDGTRCPHSLQKVLVEPETVEGPLSFSAERESIIANVLAYDNHVETARQLKPGIFLRIFNLRALPGSCRAPGLRLSQDVRPDDLAFHLHGGTAYGKGLRVLPENSPDVQELKRVIEAFKDEEDNAAMLEVWGTPPESMSEEGDDDPVVVESKVAALQFLAAERTCSHSVDPVTLSEVKRSNPGQVHHVRVQLKSYQPQRLHQSLKLFCDKCSSMQDVPDEDSVSAVFSEASRDSGCCSAPVWALSGPVRLPAESGAQSTLELFFSSQLMNEGKNRQLLFVKGASLEQVQKLSGSYLNIVPVRSERGQLTPLDLSAPVLFRGRRRYYGCKKCSKPELKEPRVDGVEVVSEKLVAEALGVELLRFSLLLRLELQDSSGSLDVLLWRDSELFFNVSASDAAANQETQNHISQTMESLCPPGGSTAHRPWLDLCLVSYEAKDDGGNKQTVYQICYSSICKSTPDPDPA